MSWVTAPSQASAFALDAADGRIDGKFYGSQVGVAGGFPTTGFVGSSFPGVATTAPTFTAGSAVTSVLPSSAPIYKTPFLGGYSNYGALGLTGAIGGLAGTPFPAASYGLSSGLYGASTAFPITNTMPLTSAFPTTSYAAPSYAAPSYAAPVTSFSTAAPVLASVSRRILPAAPEFISAPPMQLLTAPTTTFAAPYFNTQYDAGCMECAPPCPPPLPPAPLLLPAPISLPPPPAPLPPPPSVIHIKDDSGPKISSLQAEIRRLERLLAAAKETEAALRGEIGELQARLEVMAQKELQLQACDAEVQKLREQLLEMQRRITFLEGQRDEAHKHIAFLEDKLKAADAQIAQMAARIRQLEGEVANLRSRLEVKSELHSRTNVTETYKVKTFEMAAKLAVLDGTDDGLYNGLPIEVEGEGLYRDLVAKGRRPRENVSLTGRPASQTTTSETYKVQSFEMAEKLSKMDGTDDGKYNGLPIEVAGEGLYTDLVRKGRRSQASLTGGIAGVSSVTGAQTYKVSNIEMAAKISKMGGADDGTYKGLPIEVQGLGLYRDIRGRH